MAEGELQLRGRHDEGTASGIAVVKSTGKPKAIGTMTASVNSDEGPFGQWTSLGEDVNSEV